MRITLVRHGQSEANIGNFDYTAQGDSQVNLTTLGQQQAEQAGRDLAYVLGQSLTGKTLLYCSPYTRTRQTLAGMLRGAGINPGFPRIYEDARLREVDHGYGSVEEQDNLRRIHGWFYYRYAGGESPADCSDRISNFLDSMMRQVKRKDPDDIVIVSHGLAIRCFVMRFMHLTVEQFESLANPNNCDLITIDLEANVSNPMFVSGRWAMEGLRLREPTPEPLAA